MEQVCIARCVCVCVIASLFVVFFPTAFPHGVSVRTLFCTDNAQHEAFALCAY